MKNQPSTSSSLRPLPWRSVHLIGIGGVGMFGLAAILLDLGVRVSGSDAADSDNLNRLRARGASVFTGHRRANLRTPDAVVFSSAVSEDNPELRAAREQAMDCHRRGCFLALLAGYFETVVAVAGSHGKTTTTAMLAHILRETGRRPGYLIGGDVVGWDRPAAAGRDRRLLVTEVDESDATQAFMTSDLGVVINIDDDHCWSVGGEQALHECFIRFARRAACLLAWSTPATERLLADHPHRLMITRTDTVAAGLRGCLFGDHNLINGSLAVAAAVRLGVPETAAVTALRGFPGVQRRMSVRFCSPDRQYIVVEDYAHHPNELRATLETIRQRWPDHHLTAVFQPHRFERVKRYADAFRDTLETTADAAVVFRPFSAWVADEQIADPAAIAAGMKKLPCTYWQGDFEGLAETALALSGPAHRPRIFAVIGAGDINRAVTPLQNLLAAAWLQRLRQQLNQAFPDLHLDCSRSWAELTTLGIGRARPLLAAPRTEPELSALLAWLHRRRVPVTVLGSGSNTVGTDQLQPLLVIRLESGEFSTRRIRTSEVECGAAVKLPELVRELLDRGAAEPAFAPLGWIPATVGGAVRMNASAGRPMADFVRYVAGVTAAGRKFRIAATDLHWDYRRVSLDPDCVITRIGLSFPRPDAAAARTEYRRAGQQRGSTQPTGRTAGCVFRNPGDAAAGRLLEHCGLKGERLGGCRISRRHANFLVNDRQGAEADFIGLAGKAARTVYLRTGIRLIPEVKCAGSDAAARLEQTVPPLRLAVLAGGPSSERAVSLRSGSAVAAALEQAGHQVFLVDVTDRTLPELPGRIDLVFPVLHGAFGEDGTVQQLLQDRSLPYVGSGPEASRLMIDKAATKQVLAAAGIPTPAWWTVTADAPAVPADAPFPLVVKPAREGSSMGVSRISRPGPDWDRALTEAFSYCDRVLVETLITGPEITVGVVHGRPLPVVEIVPPAGHWFDFDAKYEYQRGRTEYFCPPRTVSAATQEQAREMALRAWHRLGTKDVARFDFMVDGNGVPWCLEVNSMPGFTATSLLPKAARVDGISFVELCAGLVAANLPDRCPGPGPDQTQPSPPGPPAEAAASPDSEPRGQGGTTARDHDRHE